jgi:hypothetical protein
MENNIQALAREKRNRFAGRLSVLGHGKRYHGCRYGVARIIESLALDDKRR